MFGSTKTAEYKRTAELFEQIFNEKGAYFALAFIYDSGYNNGDLKEIIKYLTPKITKKP